jgi:hypothetical protein
MNLINVEGSEPLILIEGSMVLKLENNVILANFIWLITRYNNLIYRN